ncbi:MAG: transcription elongation factor GreA [Propionibacteriaceae bacterium]|nr:transcription elongation factor GreA [Propionibacteriaceae bacterium]
MDDKIWLPESAYKKLREEFDYISGEGRAIITQRIAAAREEGDLSENAGYHAAREEQGHNELRIKQLQAVLDNADVGQVGQTCDEVRPGTLVTVCFNSAPKDTDTFLLGSRELLILNESLDVSVYSPQSPMGAAILGCKVGEHASYIAPRGNEIALTVLAIEGFTL